MAYLNVKNNAASKLAAGISDSASWLTVLTGEGARFPSSNFHITIDDEILLCSSRTNDVLTVTRAQESTGAAAHAKDAAVRLNITAAIIDELQDALKDISCRCWTSVGLTTSNGTWLDVPLDTEDFDTDNMHDTVTNNERIYAKTPGVYLIIGLLRFGSQNVGHRVGDIQHSADGRLCWVSAVPLDGGSTAIVFSCIYPMDLDAYVWMRAYQTSGGDLTLEGGSRDRTQLQMVRIGPKNA